ncbi:MAG: T9SS type A sorting domain-containing protein [Ignavibacteriaceae bacterium]
MKKSLLLITYVLLFSSLIIAQKDDTSIPDYFSLKQNYPNPFNPSTIISWQLFTDSKINIKVFNVLGNEIATIVNEELPAGNYEVKFDASNLPSGIYFYKLTANQFSETKKMTLIK